ncbi:MAG: GNAT family N-acetyltransferase [Planctomycetota bacterium]|nr:GNAT family N-acetyltransferase [Planctomycetota bacterium]
MSKSKRTLRKSSRSRREFIPVAGPEDLDKPVDADIRVDAVPPQRHKLSLMVGGEAVSGVRIVDFSQQIGSQEVRMGGIAGVETHKDHRLKGYSRRVMVNSLRWMRREGFDVSMLLGIEDFYPKFGYAEAFPHICFKVAVRDAEAATPAGYRFVDYAPGYLKAALAMYHRNNAGRTGPIRRDPKQWVPFRRGIQWGIKAVCKVALDRTGRPVGYFVYEGRPLVARIVEVGFATPAVFGDILRAAGKIAWRCRLEQIEFVLPEDDAFVGFSLPLGVRKEVTYRRDGGGMVRMINIASSLKAVASDLAGRMDKPGLLNIRTNLDSVSLFWSCGRLKVGRPVADPSPTGRYGCRNGRWLNFCMDITPLRQWLQTAS